MKILSIETSCDETSIAILEAKGGTPRARPNGRGNSVGQASFRVLGHVTASQINIHVPYGGVFPALAKREHIKNLPLVLEQTLRQAKLSPKRVLGENPGIDLIAVTHGPGLEMALWTGINFAQELAKRWGMPLIPVNHMEGHLLSVFGKNAGTFKIPKIETPLLALLVSGGHTELVLSKSSMEYEIIGETQDDAVGEAYDKVARMLGLPYPGGPEISKLAENLRTLREGLPQVSLGGISPKTDLGENLGEKFSSLPRPMINAKNFNFSFSGLKTAVLYALRDLEKSGRRLTPEITALFALEFENAAIECLTHKTIKAIEKFDAKTLVVGGGVAANTHLRRELARQSRIKTYVPPKELAGDNALMIGIAGYLKYVKNKKRVPDPESIRANGNLRLS